MVVVIVFFLSFVYFSYNIEITRPKNQRIGNENYLLFLKGTNSSYQTVVVSVECKTIEKPIDDYVFDYDILYPVVNKNVIDMIFSPQCMNTNFSSNIKEMEISKNHMCSIFIKLYKEDKETSNFNYIKYKISNKGKFEEVEKK